MKTYICPLCGHEFPVKSRQKNVKCGDHHLKVVEYKGVLTIQVVQPQPTVAKGAK